MNHLKSIRVRLPLLFAGIALLAAVLSGAMLIAILQGYYNQQERQYLQANAGQISQVAAQLIESGAPDNILPRPGCELVILCPGALETAGCAGEGTG